MNEARSGGRIGVIVPSTNVNLEPDVHLLLPRGVTAHFTRVGGYDPDDVADIEEMRAFGAAELDTAARLLAASDVGVVAYGSVSATLAHGPAFDRALAERLESAAGVPAVTAAGSLVTALAELGVRRVALASPYEPELHAATVAFLEASGVEVVGSACPDERLTGREQRALTPSEVQALALRADSSAAEAIVVACTDLRSVEATRAIERIAGKPVVASNRALVETALQRLGVGAGR